jgi:hypothetical protein
MICGAKACNLGAMIHDAELRVYFLKSFQEGSTCENLSQKGLKSKKKKDGSPAPRSAAAARSPFPCAPVSSSPFPETPFPITVAHAPHPATPSRRPRRPSYGSGSGDVGKQLSVAAATPWPHGCPPADSRVGWWFHAMSSVSSTSQHHLKLTISSDISSSSSSSQHSTATILLNFPQRCRLFVQVPVNRRDFNFS